MSICIISFTLRVALCLHAIKGFLIFFCPHIAVNLCVLIFITARRLQRGQQGQAAALMFVFMADADNVKLPIPDLLSNVWEVL